MDSSPGWLLYHTLLVIITMRGVSPGLTGFGSGNGYGDSLDCPLASSSCPWFSALSARRRAACSLNRSDLRAASPTRGIGTRGRQSSLDS